MKKIKPAMWVPASAPGQSPARMIWDGDNRPLLEMFFSVVWLKASLSDDACPEVGWGRLAKRYNKDGARIRRFLDLDESFAVVGIP